MRREVRDREVGALLCGLETTLMPGLTDFPWIDNDVDWRLQGDNGDGEDGADYLSNQAALVGEETGGQALKESSSSIV